MSKLTDAIEERFDPKKYKSMRQFLLKMGINQQKFNNWRDGAVPEDKVLIKISEKLNINFLKLVALARSNDKKGTEETRAEWKKISNQIDKQKKGETRYQIG